MLGKLLGKTTLKLQPWVLCGIGINYFPVPWEYESCKVAIISLEHVHDFEVSL